jgi:hypothetical protein
MATKAPRAAADDVDDVAGDFDPDAAMDLSDGGSESNDEGLVFNLEDVDENAGPRPLAPGVYDATVDGIEYSRSQRSNNPMWTWTFKVHDPETERERTVFFHTTFTEDGVGRVKKTLKTIHPEMDLRSVRPTDPPLELIDMPCRLRLRNRMYEGSMRTNVSAVMPPAQGGSFLDE